jgi:hypothetical protein
VSKLIAAIGLVVLGACGRGSDVEIPRSDGIARLVVGDRWNFSPGYDVERGYVDDYYVISFPVTNEGDVAGTPECKGALGDRWFPLENLEAVGPGETRWVTGTIVPDRPLEPGEDSQGVDCSGTDR